MRSIDVEHLGREHVICCWQVDDVLVDPGPESSLDTLLDAIGAEPPRALLLTHIHFDHAGAAGALVREFPDIEVWVHERGARHLVDPRRLVASAKRLYGEDFDRLWGEVVPVPERSLRVLRGGESIDGWDVAYTPGHASHHVSYRHADSGWVFPGDTCGVRMPEGDLLLPPTPPPDIDLELWQASLDTIEAWEPATLAVTHFGDYRDVAEHIARLREALTKCGELARTTDLEGYSARLLEIYAAGLPGDAAASFAQAMPVDQQWLGLDRYWSRKRESAESA
jgi:glyoxylase-like metal-dependent hydrolase (beta-lactamase superfamily II)